MTPVFIYLLLTLTAATMACAVVAAAFRLWPAPPVERPVSLDHLGEPRSFCFRDGYLISSDRGSGFLLPEPLDRLSAWDDLRNTLAELIPGAAAAMDALARRGEGFRIEGKMGRDRLHLMGLRDGEDLRITLATADQGQNSVRIDIAPLAALEAENALLTRSHATAPGLAWVLDEDGRVIWANGRYLDEVARRHGADAGAAWPIPVLFPDHSDAPTGATRRCLGQGEGQEGESANEDWFEVVIGAAEGGLRHAHAQPLARLIEAEESLRRVIQMLTNTFVALPTGLAIFDASRRLVQFNPPWMDMTGLDTTWLAGRPHLTDVLDALREHQRLPEPRDWKAWRDALVATGSSETQEVWHETWTLPGGQSFRMTARPLASAAVAILLEDITAEMTLARRRRSDGDTLAALLDAAEDAVASFGPDGTPLHLNVHMRELGGFDIEMPPSLEDFLSRWAALCDPTPLWGEIRDLNRSSEPRADWTETVRLADGQTLDVQVLPLSEGRVALRMMADLAALHGLRRDGEEIQNTARALVATTRGKVQDAERA